MIFVFGSNLRGVHGAGAARFALKKKGAVYGRGYGHVGDSWAIPTKDHNINTLPLEGIKQYVNGFIHYAKEHPELDFQVTCIGCGLAGYSHKDIAPLFKGMSMNCYIDAKWSHWLPHHLVWGEG